MKRRLPERFEVEITALGERGVGLGTAPDGRPIRVHGAPPGSRVRVVPLGRAKGVWEARRETLIRPPPRYAVPPCPSFGTCGGCVFQELDADAQRAMKADAAMTAVAAGLGVPVADLPTKPCVPASSSYGYRNRVELGFAPRRWLSAEDKARGLEIPGRWLGFHAPGRFDRVVDVERCWLAGEATNAVIAAVRAVALLPDAPPPWDAKDHTGFWRQVLIRESDAGDVFVALYTASGDGEWPARVADAVHAADLGEKRLVGFDWYVNDGVADVARGALARRWGAERFTEKLGDLAFSLSPNAFFQTSTRGARVLYDVIGEALGSGGTLLDLYCGVGSIGLYHAGRFERVVGVEEVADAVSDAALNAANNGITHATFRAAKVEDALVVLDEVVGRRSIVVDPPRAGLHPKVAKALSSASADVLVYVACHPPSLGRDAPVLLAGGWKLDALWTVDIFPQTHHLEAVARFVRA